MANLTKDLSLLVARVEASHGWSKEIYGERMGWVFMANLLWLSISKKKKAEVTKSAENLIASVLAKKVGE